MDLPALARWAAVKGIDVLGSGDFTHPQWFTTLEAGLVPADDGLYRHGETLFMLTAEVAAIWSQAGRVRKVHLLVLVPSLEGAARVNRELAQIGNLAADGRPMLGIAAQSLVEAIWGAEPKAVVIPAHVWTPWFSVFGSRSGFDSLEECFGKHTDRIFAVETGLSSDPAMNWRLSGLDEIALVSNSDAHSPAKLGREVSLFDLPAASYNGIVAAMKERDPTRFVGTIEFFPQEGKYHYDGHRACGIVLEPREAMAKDNRCPVCGRPLTIGVMHRVEELADRPEGWTTPGRVPFRSLVPLEEIIAQAIGVQPGTKRVAQEYERLIGHFGSEFRILLDLQEDELRKATSPRLLQAIRKVRAGELDIEPGYDGVYGKINIPLDAQEQLSLL